MAVRARVILAFCVLFITIVYGEKFRVCVVDGRGGFKRAAKYCPVLDDIQSKVECVVGIDRLDCLRRISKGKADFSVFSPEDLVTAINSEIDVLISNVMLFTDDIYEYKVVAVVSDDSGISSKHSLKGKKFCHPGYGYETDWTNIIANYLEASVVPQTCNRSISLTENRIQASSKFFKSACKAGPWVRQPDQDALLKAKYPNLCELCNSPNSCSNTDKYWGRRGPLYCLTDGLGDVSWARLDDVQAHFNLSFSSGGMSPEGYSLLCPDDTVMNLDTRMPCVWVVKPWPAIATQRKKAQDIQEFFKQVDQKNPNRWEDAFLNLIETFKQTVNPLDPVLPIETYLTNAPGFLSANSFTGCHPPRTIRICTTTNVAFAKCGWMREVASVYGIEPDMDCIKAANDTHCMDAIKNNFADLIFVHPDYESIAINKYNLKPIIYETVADEDRYKTVPVVHKDSSYQVFDDLKGAKACFPIYDGVAWNSVMSKLKDENKLGECNYEDQLLEYFSKSCVPGLPDRLTKDVNSLCHKGNFEGEYGAIRCLGEGHGDVAFISENSLNKFFADHRELKSKLRKEDFRILCEDEKSCFIKWAPIGLGLTSRNKPDMWIKETVDVLLQVDMLFGRNYKSVTPPFTMYGLFNEQKDVLFYDATMRLRTVPESKDREVVPKKYDYNLIRRLKYCSSSSSRNVVNLFVFVFLFPIFYEVFFR